MGHLGESAPITTVEDKEVVLTGSDGQLFKMKLADLTEAVRQVMPMATSDKNGLMSYGFFNSIIILELNMRTDEIYDTGINRAGLLLIQNESVEHDLAMAIIFKNSMCKIISRSSGIGFNDSTNSVVVVKDGVDATMKLKNNSTASRSISFRFICLDL